MKRLKTYNVFELMNSILDKITSLKNFIIETDNLSDLKTELI